MDPVLAELYGTLKAPPSTEGMQKTAELELLAKIAEDNNIDVNKLSDKQIMDAYNELHGVVSGGQEKVASQQQMEKEAAEMFKNADYMGRIMAHSFINELGGIQKRAEEAAAEEKKEEKAEEKKEEKSENPLIDKIREMKEEKKEEKSEEKAEEKTAAVINRAIEKRAYEFLAAAGLLNSDGSIQPPPALQKVAQEDIDRAALRILEEMGYPVEWKK